jgi:hypothetical protein
VFELHFCFFVVFCFKSVPSLLSSPSTSSSTSTCVGIVKDNILKSNSIMTNSLPLNTNLIATSASINNYNSSPRPFYKHNNSINITTTPTIGTKSVLNNSSIGIIDSTPQKENNNNNNNNKTSSLKVNHFIKNSRYNKYSIGNSPLLTTSLIETSSSSPSTSPLIAKFNDDNSIKCSIKNQSKLFRNLQKTLGISS